MDFGALRKTRTNPNGIESISPGLQGTSYPGNTENNTTLKGLNGVAWVGAGDSTLSGLMKLVGR